MTTDQLDALRANLEPHDTLARRDRCLRGAFLNADRATDRAGLNARYRWGLFYEVCAVLRAQGKPDLYAPLRTDQFPGIGSALAEVIPPLVGPSYLDSEASLRHWRRVTYPAVLLQAGALTVDDFRGDVAMALRDKDEDLADEVGALDDEAMTALAASSGWDVQEAADKAEDFLLTLAY